MEKNISKLRFSIVIPTHEMEGGADFLRRSLGVLNRQTFTDFEIIIPDNSENDVVEKVIEEFPDLGVIYFKNPIKGMAQNTNAGIEVARGELIKILYMDDYLFGETALADISRAFKEDDYWLVTGCAHSVNGEEPSKPHYPTYNQLIHTGLNTIGSPSVLAVRNEGRLLFDEKMTWLLDCDLYRRYYDTYGEPRILNYLNVVIGQGPHQVTNLISEELKEREEVYILKKYE